MNNRTIQGLFVFAQFTFRGNFISVVSILFSQIQRVEDAIGTLARFDYNLTFCPCHSKTSNNFFQNTPTNQKCQNDVLHGNLNIDTSATDVLCIYIYIYMLYIYIYVIYIYIYIYTYIMGVFLKLRDNCETNWDSIQF